MNRIKIKNVKIYTEEKKFIEGAIFVADGKIGKCSFDVPDVTGKTIREDSFAIIDGENCYALPGLIDLHFHGCDGVDFCDGTREAFDKIAEYEVTVGVTAIAPATMTLPVKELERILVAASDYVQEQKEKAALEDCKRDIDGSICEGHAKKKLKSEIVGINMEGPFISKKKKGAQDEENILPCNVRICERFLEASKGLVKFVGIAPEEGKHTIEFIQRMKDKVQVSLAHTNADYDTAMAAFRAGATHAVHLYNAMPVFSHREPGVVGAVADCSRVMAELICDGVHLHPAIVRATFKILGEDRIIFISDSMRATGRSDGFYTLGGQEVLVKKNCAKLVSDGAIAGSVTNLLDCMRIAVKQMKIPLETAVACATINPARSLGIEKDYGSIAPGKKADLILLDEDLNLKMVMKSGEVAMYG